MSDEEIDITPNSGEEERGSEPQVQFLPSVFEQAREIESEASSLTAGEDTTEKKKELPPVEFDIDDVRDAVSVPFDLAAIFTKHKGFELSPEQQERLGRRWLRPFQRHFGTVKGMDIYMALAATVTIITDKTLDYLEEKEKKEKLK